MGRFQTHYFWKILPFCSAVIPLVILTSCCGYAYSGREYFDTHADEYSWKCEEIDFKFSTHYFNLGTSAHASMNQPRAYRSTPIEISTSPTYFDVYLSEDTDIENKISCSLSREWKAVWETFFDRSVVLWKYTDYYDAFFCYKFINVIESIDQAATSHIMPEILRTNWTLETSLTDSSIYFFQKKDIPEDVLQQYNTIRDYLLLNDELTFNTYEPVEDEIPYTKVISYSDRRKNILRLRTLLNN